MMQPDFWAIIRARTPQPVPTSSMEPAPEGSAHEPSNILSVPIFIVEFESSTLKYLKRNDISKININQPYRRLNRNDLFLTVNRPDNAVGYRDQDLLPIETNLEKCLMVKVKYGFNDTYIA